MSIQESFGKRLTQMRKEAKLSQKELAEKLGVSAPYISGIENGKENITIKKLEQIAKALKVSLSYLLDIKAEAANGYLYKKGSLEASLKKWTGKEWYHQRFDGVPYLLHMIAEAELYTHRDKKRDYAFDVHYCFNDETGADWFILQDDIDRISGAILKELENKDDYGQELMSHWTEPEKTLHEHFEQLEKTDLQSLSDRELVEVHNNFLNDSLERFSSSSVIDGFALGSDEVLEARLKEIYDKQENPKDVFSTFFSDVTAPVHLSFVNEVDLKLFQSVEAYHDDASQLDELAEKMRQEYYWIRNNYRDSYNLQAFYFRDEIIRVYSGGEEVKKKISEITELTDSVLKRKEQLYKDYGVDEYTKKLIRITEQFTKWQDDRKMDTMKCTHYFVSILEEFSRRTGVELEELKYMSPRVVATLFDDSSDQTRANPFCVMYWGVHEHERICGKEDYERIKHAVLGDENNADLEDFRGMSASAGKATGTVRVLKTVNQVDKVQEGDILVAVMTRPDYVPAMKVAAAIVTNEGGITCHAAIVSRELNKPCIIGTKQATEILKDGDTVEVDANHGVVRIIERS